MVGTIVAGSVDDAGIVAATSVVRGEETGADVSTGATAAIATVVDVAWLVGSSPPLTITIVPTVMAATAAVPPMIATRRRA